MKATPERQPLDGGIWGFMAVGAVAAGAALVLTMGSPHTEDVGQSAITAYVASIEQNDIPSACRHATQAADNYSQHGEDVVARGWHTIAHAVCPDGQVRRVAHLEP